MIVDEEKSFKDRELYYSKEKQHLLDLIKQNQTLASVTKDFDEQRLIKNKVVGLQKQLKEKEEEYSLVVDVKNKKILELNKRRKEALDLENNIRGPQDQQTQDVDGQIQELDDKKGLTMRRTFANMNEEQNLAPAQPAPVQPKKDIIVNFDKSTKTPFQVKFTERGFSIGETRLSFEMLEVAISKQFNITLDSGNGLVLDAIKMQKILKYKNRS